MKINVIYNKFIPEYEAALTTVIKSLTEYGVNYDVFDLEDMKFGGDMSFVIGGDGTLLRAARFYSEFKKPVLGINMGRLGFLSQAAVSDIDSVIKSVITGKYSVEDRLMLESGEHLALNDFVVKGCTPGRTSKFFLEVNNKVVCDYIADGIIISTPTGSTAYGLSAGGPILYPDLGAIVIVPICPHTLNARPLVVPSSQLIAVKTNDELLSVSIDGFVTTNYVEKVDIKASPHRAKLIFPENNNFYVVLRNKLNWGVSPECKY